MDAVPFRRAPRRPRRLLVVDVRRYRQRTGRFLVSERLFVRGVWTPLVRVRARRPRAADGGTEI